MQDKGLDYGLVDWGIGAVGRLTVGFRAGKVPIWARAELVLRARRRIRIRIRIRVGSRVRVKVGLCAGVRLGLGSGPRSPFGRPQICPR